MINVDDWQPVNLMVNGWVTQWASNLNRAKAHEVTLTERVQESLPDHVRAQVSAQAGKRLRDQVAELADEQGLLVLAEAPVDEHWSGDRAQFRLRVLICDRAPVPPIKEWVRFTGRG